MKDRESHHELDDELLSAYLDDELSPDARAAVEARLAADPSAAELLHQLRNVSQAVQALPQEASGYDLRQAVMDRVRSSRNKPTVPFGDASAQAATSGPAAAATVDSGSALTIGRTRRGWVWASLAVAAALLIMALQAEPERDELAVADRNTKSANKRGGSARLELRPLNEQLDRAAAAEPAAAAPAAGPPTVALDAGAVPAEDVAPTTDSFPSEMTTRRLARDSETEPLGQSVARAPEAKQEAKYYLENDAVSGLEPDARQDDRTETLAARDPAAMPPAEPGQRADQYGALAYRETPALSKEQVEGNGLMVVRVLAKTTALEANTFERLLERNGIEVESPNTEVAEETLAENARSRRFAIQDQSGAERQKRAQSQQGTEPFIEAVLVEAPESTILSCLEGLNRDDENYLGLEVESARLSDSQVAANGAAGVEAAPKAVTQSDSAWTKYNRGFVPLGEDADARDRYSYFPQRENFRGGVGGYAATADDWVRLKETELSLALKNLSEARSAKAVRLHTWSLDPKNSSQPWLTAPERATASNVRSPVRLDEVERRASAPVAINDNNMQVLFLLQPDESAATSPVLKTRAQ